MQLLVKSSIHYIFFAAKPYRNDKKINKKKTTAQKDSFNKTAKHSRKYNSYSIENDFDYLDDGNQDDKAAETTATMLALPKAVHHRREIKEKVSRQKEAGKSERKQAKIPVLEETRTNKVSTIPQSMKNFLEDDDSEDNEAIKLRQFCEVG